MFFQKTRPAPYLPVYDTRKTMALYLSHFSVKLKWAAGHAANICLQMGRKLLVFCAWPVTQFLTECYLINLGFKVISIRAAHKLSTRNEARL